MPKDTLSLDFETFCDANLKDVGADVYTRDPSAEILMGAYKLNGSKVAQWDEAQGEDPPREFTEALYDPEVEKWAWNSAFEMNCIRHIWKKPVDVTQWRDSMVLAQLCGFPGQLEKAGPAIGLEDDKLKVADGKKLIRLFSIRQKSRRKATMGQMIRTHWYDNLPRWEDYLTYNRGDVVAETEIKGKLLPFDPGPEEWALWHLDQTINYRGLPINLEMVRNASQIYHESYQIGFKVMQEITGLANPMSTQQILPWLKANGYMFDDMLKGHVKQARGYFDSKPEHWDHDQWEEYRSNADLLDVLDLRLELSRTSIKKFDALLRATVPEGNGQSGLLRFTLQFAGAPRTARWAGRLFQAQNLPRPEKQFEKEIEIHAVNVAKLDRESIELIYPNTFDILASTIRPAAQAPEGKVFIDADLNAIENRVLGWLARCRKILAVFEDNRDPYVDFATYLFHETYAKLIAEYKAGDGSKRTIAKPGVLGCLKGETPVLTDKGWKAVVEVRRGDWLWDGQKWVTHEGVVFKGDQEVLSRSGIHATPDHRFLTISGWQEWQQVSRQPIFKSALDMGNGAFLATQDRRVQPERNFFAAVNVVENERYQDRTLSEGYPLVAPDVLLGTVAPTSESESAQTFSTFSQIVSTLRERVARTRKTVLTSITEGVEYVCGSQPASSSSSTSSNPSAQTVGWKSTEPTTKGTTSGGTYDLQLDHSKTEIADTWDILNTGDYARFAVLTDDGPVISHNCGYMLSAGKVYEDRKTGEIEATGLLGYAWGMGVKHFTLKDSELSVKTFRREFSEVKDYWYGIERAAKKAIRTGRRVIYDQIAFDIRGDFLRMELPSGRFLHYYKPRIEKRKAPWGDMKDTITYMGVDDRKQFVRLTTHPGKLTENADQAISRDLLAHGMMLAHRRYGLDIRLHVHDQIIAVADEDKADTQLAQLIECMEEPPVWAHDCPLGSAGFHSTVFKKD